MRTLHHHKTHGSQSHPKSAGQGFPAFETKGRSMGRRLPGKYNLSIINSPDSTAAKFQSAFIPTEFLRGGIYRDVNISLTLTLTLTLTLFRRAEN
jgi:hypothetical protein